jgi:hypothetical protein
MRWCGLQGLFKVRVRRAAKGAREREKKGRQDSKRASAAKTTHLISEPSLFDCALHYAATQESVAVERGDVRPHYSVYLCEELLRDLAQPALDPRHGENLLDLTHREMAETVRQ